MCVDGESGASFPQVRPSFSRGKRKLNWPAATVRCDRALFFILSSVVVFYPLFFFFSLPFGGVVCVLCVPKFVSETVGNAFFVVRKAGMLRLDDAKVK